MLECFILEPFFRRIGKGRIGKEYTQIEWYTNGTLQLQRLAHEENGYGTWSNCDDEVPVTGAGDRLATLDLSDPKHPKLTKASSKLVMSTVRTFGSDSTTYEATGNASMDSFPETSFKAN